jgi:histidinol dehydrogenase
LQYFDPIPNKFLDENSFEKLDADVKSAFDVAYGNIYAFHAAQNRTHELEVENMPVCLFFLYLL